MAQIGDHIVKSGPTLQSLTAIERWRSGVLRSVEREVKLDYPCESMYKDLGIPMKI